MIIRSSRVHAATLVVHARAVVERGLAHERDTEATAASVGCISAPRWWAIRMIHGVVTRHALHALRCCNSWRRCRCTHGAGTFLRRRWLCASCNCRLSSRCIRTFRMCTQRWPRPYTSVHQSRWYCTCACPLQLRQMASRSHEKRELSAVCTCCTFALPCCFISDNQGSVRCLIGARYLWQHHSCWQQGLRTPVSAARCMATQSLDCSFRRPDYHSQMWLGTAVATPALEDVPCFRLKRAEALAGCTRRASSQRSGFALGSLYLTIHLGAGRAYPVPRYQLP